MFQYLTFNITGKARKDTLEGRAHLVVPAVMMAEGVWEGSRGPVYYPADELSHAVPSWNHKPVVAYHPKTDGQNVSACDPIILSTRRVGILLNTKWKEKKQKTEVWLDVERTKSVDDRILDAVNKGEKVETSTGLYIDPDETPGVWNDKPYEVIARRHRPDHFAILPDGIGAFSVKDGGGLLANEVFQLPQRNQRILMRGLELAAGRVGALFTENELSYNQVSMKLSDLLASKYGQPGKYWAGYICDVYDGYCVFHDPYMSEEPGQYWMIDYNVGKDDEVTIAKEAVGVKRVTEYQANNGKSYIANAGGGLDLKPVEEEEMAFDKKAHIAGLIGKGWEETDRTALEAMDEKVLAKIQPTVNAAPPPTPTPPPPEKKPAKGQTDDDDEEAKKEEEKKKKKEEEEKKKKGGLAGNAVLTSEEILAALPAETRKYIERQEKRAKEQKEALVAELSANEACPFDKAYLEGKDLEELEGLAAMARRADHDPDDDEQVGNRMFKEDFSLAAGGPVTTNKARQDVYLPIPGIEPPTPAK